MLILSRYRHLDSTCDFPAACAGPCNAVLVIWTETTVSPGGVSLVIDAVELSILPGLAKDVLPGLQGYLIDPFAAADTRIRIEDVTTGTVLEDTLTVLDSQPFQEVQTLTCAEGGPGEQGTCELVIAWEIRGTLPSGYSVHVNRIFQLKTPCSPTLRGNKDGNDVHIPTCTRAASEVDCVESHPACSGAGG